MRGPTRAAGRSSAAAWPARSPARAGRRTGSRSRRGRRRSRSRRARRGAPRPASLRPAPPGSRPRSSWSDSWKASGKARCWSIQRSAAAFETLKCSQRKASAGVGDASHATASSAPIALPRLLRRQQVRADEAVLVGAVGGECERWARFLHRLPASARRGTAAGRASGGSRTRSGPRCTTRRAARACSAAGPRASRPCAR